MSVNDYINENQYSVEPIPSYPDLQDLFNTYNAYLFATQNENHVGVFNAHNQNSHHSPGLQEAVPHETQDPEGNCSRNAAVMIKGTDGYWVCSQCPKKYARKSRAQEHMDTHNGNKRYKCTGQCGTWACVDSFASKDGLRCHTKRTRVKCPICDMMITAKNVARHRRTVHTDSG